MSRKRFGTLILGIIRGFTGEGNIATKALRHKGNSKII